MKQIAVIIVACQCCRTHGTHQLLVYADANLLKYFINTFAGKQAAILKDLVRGLVQNIKHICMSLYQKARTCSIKTIIYTCKNAAHLHLSKQIKFTLIE